MSLFFHIKKTAINDSPMISQLPKDDTFPSYVEVGILSFFKGFSDVPGVHTEDSSQDSLISKCRKNISSSGTFNIAYISPKNRLDTPDIPITPKKHSHFHENVS